MKYLWLIVLLSSTALAHAQTVTPAEKEITNYLQSWLSFNSTFRFSNRWGAVGDIHVRRDEGFKNNYFYFLRVGGVYWVKDKYPVIAGFAHLWLAPPDGKNTWGNENRIYQQWSAATPQGDVSILHRIRLEQRWRDQIINDEVVGSKQFSLRLRYLASFEFRLAKDPKKPRLVVSDEVLVQFGETIVYNTFDQNRLFLGFKVPLDDKFSLDVGYMNILQQKSTGYQYAMSHVLRLFFYYNLDLTPNKSDIHTQENAE